MEPRIIFEDDEILVLDKPAGWIVNEAETTASTPVIQTWLKENFQFPIFNFQEGRNGIVHRLDKETSGILLVGKTEKAFYELQRQFKERIVKKTYIALLHGRVEPKVGEIKAPVGRLPWRRDRFGVIPGGRDSLTNYKVTSYYVFSGTHNSQPTTYYTLAEFYPQTGRTHQIRIHAKYIGHPIVGDEFYAGRKTARNDRKWCPRLFLHALRISFTHPIKKSHLSVESKLSSDLANVLSHLNLVS